MTESTSAASNDAMIREFLAAWERRDPSHILDCFTDNAVYHSIPLTPIVGKAAIREFVTKFADVAPGRLEIRHQLASGDVVINERTDHIIINGTPSCSPSVGSSRSRTAASGRGASTSTSAPPERRTDRPDRGATGGPHPRQSAPGPTPGQGPATGSGIPTR